MNPTKKKKPPVRKPSIGKHKTTEELAAEQGIKIPQDLSKIMGAGADLWANDAELDAFLDDVRKARGKAG
jgi:hypothetical protein